MIKLSNYKKLLLDSKNFKNINSMVNLESFANCTQYTQRVPANVWSINHNLHKTVEELYIEIFINVGDSLQKVFMPSIANDTGISFDINFYSEQNVGLVNIFYFGATDEILSVALPSPTPTPTFTPTLTMTPTLTQTLTVTPTLTQTRTITPTLSLTSTVTPTLTVTPTITMTQTMSPTLTQTVTPTVTISQSPSPPPSTYTIPPQLARLNSDGTLDTTFVSLQPSNTVSYFCQTSDGKIYISFSGTIGGYPYKTVARLNSNGTLDASFNEIMNTGSGFAVIQKAANGKIYVGGRFLTAGTPYTALCRLNSDGTLDTTFTRITFGAINPTVYGIFVSSDQKIYVFGSTVSPANGNTLSGGIFRLNSDGTYDSTFTTVFPSGVDSMCQDSFGKIWCGLGSNIVRLNSDGTLDTTMAALTTNNPVYSIMRSADDKIYAAGLFLSNVNGNTNYNSVFRLTSAGIVDTTFVSIDPDGLTIEPDSVVQTADGKIYVSGVNGNTGFGNLIRLNSDGTLDTSYTSPTFNSETRMVYQTVDDKIYVGGDFTG